MSPLPVCHERQKCPALRLAAMFAINEKSCFGPAKQFSPQLTAYLQAMPTTLTNSLKAWGTSGFNQALKQEIEQLDPGQLPLQQGLARSSHVADSKFSAIILRVSDDVDFIHAKVGISYAGIIAGCSCADDPTPISEQAEYCEVLLAIDKRSGETTVTLVSE